MASFPAQLFRTSRQAAATILCGGRSPSVNLQVLEKLHERLGNTNVTKVTVGPGNSAQHGRENDGRMSQSEAVWRGPMRQKLLQEKAFRG
jgi:hypothetical protein